MILSISRRKFLTDDNDVLVGADLDPVNGVTVVVGLVVMHDVVAAVVIVVVAAASDFATLTLKRPSKVPRLV